jgi:hypothetical protein
MLSAPWLIADISIKTGLEGLSGQIPETYIEIHQRNREGRFPVEKDILVIVAADLEGVAMPVYVEVDNFVGRVNHVYCRTRKQSLRVAENVEAIEWFVGGHCDDLRFLDHQLDKTTTNGKSGKILEIIH